nr:MAG TPA_asm: hypothetical protein [Caudoviricetes sp.]
MLRMLCEIHSVSTCRLTHKTRILTLQSPLPGKCSFTNQRKCL